MPFYSKLCVLFGKSEGFQKAFTSLQAKIWKFGKFLELSNYLKKTRNSNWSVVGFGYFFVAIPILCLSSEKPSWWVSEIVCCLTARHTRVRSLFSVRCACLLIHLIPKWRPINYSFVCMLLSPRCLVSMYKTWKNFEVKLRQRGLINMQTKE